MPIAYLIDPVSSVVFLVATGHINAAQLADVRRSVLGDRRHRPGMGILADCRRFEVDVSFDDVAALAVSLRRYEDAFGAAAIAIVVSSDLHYGLARMYQSFAVDARPTVRVFRGLELARMWLGLDAERRTTRTGERRRRPSGDRTRPSGERRGTSGERRRESGGRAVQG